MDDEHPITISSLEFILNENHTLGQLNHKNLKIFLLRGEYSINLSLYYIHGPNTWPAQQINCLIVYNQGIFGCKTYPMVPYLNTQFKLKQNLLCTSALIG